MGKINTCKPSSRQARLERQLEGIQKHRENFPDDKLSQQRASTIRAGTRQMIQNIGYSWLYPRLRIKDEYTRVRMRASHRLGRCNA